MDSSSIPAPKGGLIMASGGAEDKVREWQPANGVWLTDHVPPGCLSGWPG